MDGRHDRRAAGGLARRVLARYAASQRLKRPPCKRHGAKLDEVTDSRNCLKTVNRSGEIWVLELGNAALTPT